MGVGDVVGDGVGAGVGEGVVGNGVGEGVGEYVGDGVGWAIVHVTPVLHLPVLRHVGHCDPFIEPVAILQPHPVCQFLFLIAQMPTSAPVIFVPPAYRSYKGSFTSSAGNEPLIGLPVI